jgi:hypothetical protein
MVSPEFILLILSVNIYFDCITSCSEHAWARYSNTEELSALVGCLADHIPAEKALKSAIELVCNTRIVDPSCDP